MRCRSKAHTQSTRSIPFCLLSKRRATLFSPRKWLLLPLKVSQGRPDILHRQPCQPAQIDRFSLPIRHPDHASRARPVHLATNQLRASLAPIRPTTLCRDPLREDERPQVRHRLVFLPSHPDPGVAHPLGQEPRVRVTPLAAAGEHVHRTRTRPIRRCDGADQGMREERAGAVEVLAWRIRRPLLARGVGRVQAGLCGLEDIGAKVWGEPGAGQIRGRAQEGQAGRHWQFHVVTAEGKRRVGSEGDVTGAAAREDNLEQQEAQIGTCAVAGEDDIGSRHNVVDSAGRWVQERKVGYQCVDEGRGKGAPRRQSIVHNQDAAAREGYERRQKGAVSRR